jgi:hypothetical protein
VTSKSQTFVRLPNGQNVTRNHEFIGAAAIAEAMDRDTNKLEKWLRKHNLREPKKVLDYTGSAAVIEPLVPKVGGKYELVAWRLIAVFNEHVNFPYSKKDPRHDDYDWKLLKPVGKRGQFTTKK